MPEEGAGHLSEEGLDDVEPGAMFGCVHVDESVGAGCQILPCLTRDMRRVVIQQDSNDGFSRIVSVEILEKTNELAAAMPALDAGSDVPVVQIDGSQDRDSYHPAVLVVACRRRVPARHRWQVWGCGGESLNPWLLI